MILLTMQNIIKTLIYLLTGFVVSFTLVYLVKTGIDNNRDYNAHVCAVYGKQPDCKTPLEVK